VQDEVFLGITGRWKEREKRKMGAGVYLHLTKLDFRSKVPRTGEERGGNFHGLDQKLSLGRFIRKQDLVREDDDDRDTTGLSEAGDGNFHPRRERARCKSGGRMDLLLTLLAQIRKLSMVSLVEKGAGLTRKKRMRTLL